MAAKNKFMNAMKMPAIADMFSSEADRQRESGDLVTEVSLSELHVDRIQTALENCIAERGKERPIPELRDLCDRAAQRVKEMNQSRPVPPPEHGERL